MTTEESVWEREEVQAHMGVRTLETKCPPLGSFLYPGAKVLDVGCGPGSITLDVANAVVPGTAVGIDPSEEATNQARELAAERQVDNVTFQVGDTYGLEFPDETFDITYSHNVLVWIRDPVRALEEQKRVTKPGGWVIGAISDWGTRLVYPPCPALEGIWASWRHLNDPSDPVAFWNVNLGREVVAVFAQAGLDEVRVEGYVAQDTCVYPGSGYREHQTRQWRMAYQYPTGPLAQYLGKLVALGVLDEGTLQAAQQEIEAWHGHPHAFFAETAFLAAGRVP